MGEPKRQFGVRSAGAGAGGGGLPLWQVRCLEALSAVPGVELALRIAPERASAVRGPRCRALSHVPAPGAWTAAPVVSEDDAETIARLGLAFVLDLEPQPVGGGLAAAARLGVWGFFHGPDGGPCAWPPGLAELERGDRLAEVRLCAVSGEPNRARLLQEGAFRLVGHSLARSCDRLLLGIAAWPARACREPAQPEPVASGTAGQPVPRVRVEAPHLGRRLRLRARLARNALRRLSDMLVEEQWAVGLAERPVDSFLSDPNPGAVRWLPEPADGMVADPFALPSADGAAPRDATLLVEELDFAQGIGRISALDPDAERPLPRTVVAGPAHLSYPFLLEHAGRTFCIPDAGATRRVRLLEACPFPDAWREVAVLIDGFGAVDPTVFHHEGLWWLLCGNRDDEDQAKLYGWLASDLEGPWRPHPLNPLKCDPRSSRPAGRPFTWRGDLYRPAQDCSLTYGGAVTLNRVVALGPDTFREQVVARVAPDPSGPYPDGLHTLCGAGPRTVLDGKRHVRSLRPLWVRTATLRRAFDRRS